MRNHTKIIAIFFLLLVVGVLVPTHGAKAADGCTYTNITFTGCAIMVVGGVQQALGYLLSGAANLLERLILWSQGGAAAAPPVIHEVWGIVRDFVNMFFILVLIIMAFGTIFDIKDYKFQDMFPRFLVAALLINFSFVITTYILGLANGLAGVFLHSMTQIADRLGMVLHMGTHQLANPAPIEAINTGFSSLLTILGMTVFIAIALGALASAAIFVLIRIVVVWLLLILSPIAWFGMTLPSLKKQTWDKWWETFISWSFFLPCYLFFVMIATVIVSKHAQVGDNYDISVVSKPGDVAAKLLEIFPVTDILFFTLAIFILIGGIWASFQIGSLAANGAGAVMGFAQGRIKAIPIPGTGKLFGGRMSSWSDFEAGAQHLGQTIEEKGAPIKSLKWLWGGREGQKRGADFMGSVFDQQFGYAAKGAVGPQSEVANTKNAKADIERDITLGNTNIKDVVDSVKADKMVDLLGNINSHMAAAALLAAEQGALDKDKFAGIMKELKDKNPLLAKDIAAAYVANISNKKDLLGVAAPVAGSVFNDPRMASVRKEASRFLVSDKGQSTLRDASTAQGQQIITQAVADYGGKDTPISKAFIKSVAGINPEAAKEFYMANGGLAGNGYDPNPGIPGDTSERAFYRKHWQKSKATIAEMPIETWRNPAFQAELFSRAPADPGARIKYKQDLAQSISDSDAADAGLKIAQLGAIFP